MILKVPRRFPLFVAGILFLSTAGSRTGFAAGEKRDSLVFAAAGDPKTFNPVLAQETSSSEILQFVFDGLTRLNPVTGEIEPMLAEKWEAREEGLVWTFHLRRDVLWADGDPFDSADVLFTFNDVIANPDVLANSRDIFKIEGKPVQVTAVDRFTVEFRLLSVFAPFLSALGQPILPEHILKGPLTEGKFSNSWGIDEAPAKIIGTGPYRMVSYEPGERIRLVRNPRYWKRGAGGETLPYIQEIMILIVPGPDLRLLKFLEGETDIYSASGRDYAVLGPKAEKTGNFLLLDAGPSNSSNFIVFNQNSKDPDKKDWFRRRDFRLAAAHAIDRGAMTDIVFNGLGSPECSAVSPANKAHFNPDVLCYEFDPQRAKSLLDSMGFQDKNGDGLREDPSGKLVEFVLLTNAENPERLQMAGMIREDFARIGLKAHFLALEFNSLVSRLVATGEWDAVMLGLTGSEDPHFGANVWRSSGALHFWNRGATELSPWETRVDELFDLGVRTIDPAARKAVYGEWQEIAARELPMIYLILPKVVFAVRDRFDNLKPSALAGILHNIEEIKIRNSGVDKS